MAYNNYIKVKINGLFYPMMEASLTIDEAVDERSTASFMCKVNDLSTNIVKGMCVEIYDTFEELIFSGFINNAKSKDYKERGFKLFSVDCVDNHYLADKRIYTRGFIDTSCGDIVRQMIDEVLSQEGITYTESSIQEGFHIDRISFPYLYCDDIMDKLCELCGYSWFIDYEKVLYFYEPSTRTSNANVTDGDVINDSLVSENGNDQYRNKQYIKGATGETGEIVQEFKGDGITRSFTLGFPLADKPKIYVNDEYIAEDDIVIKGYNDTAKYFYQVRDAVIAQNEFKPDAEGNLIANPPLGANDRLKVVYRGLFPIVAITENTGERERLMELEGGTGLIEVVDNEDNINTISMAIRTAVGRLAKYGSESNKVTFDSLSDKFKVGEVISFNTSVFTGSDYLIQSVTKTDDGIHIRYTVTAVHGTVYDSWTRSFGYGLRKSETVANMDLAEQETVVLSFDFRKTWTESENPNIIRIIYPNGTVLTNGSRTPSFEYEHRVRFIEIVDNENKVVARNIFTSQSDSTKNNIYTSFFINPFDAIGRWSKVRFYGGSEATFEYESGILIDEQACVLNKTELEGVQITRTDLKGW